jgi:hypothetical protein
MAVVSLRFGVVERVATRVPPSMFQTAISPFQEPARTSPVWGQKAAWYPQSERVSYVASCVPSRFQRLVVRSALVVTRHYPC